MMLYLLQGIYIILALHVSQSFGARSFYIDYENDTFVKDGAPFRYISGSVHSYRIPRDLWSDRLNKMYAAGLNAIQIYLFWNEHEPTPGVYDFEGQNDVFSFIELAQKTGFVVILRPGPYICGEHDYGGLPWWLLANGTDTIRPRTSEATYVTAVNRYFQQLLPRLVPYLYKNGGPIITIQIENEYGFFSACDSTYKLGLRDLFKSILGDDVVFFTTDPAHVLKCGVIPGVFATVDFGIDVDPEVPFAEQLKFNQGKGPYVNSEFYPGWLDFWGTPHQKRPTAMVIQRLDKILALKANVNFYMFHGGTNFGFSNGADPPFQVEPTTYDYDAPMTEAGDITPKYMAIRSLIAKYSPLPPVPIPANSTKVAYGKIQMTNVGFLPELIMRASIKIDSKYPLSFEQLGQGYGFVMYATTLDAFEVDGKVLSIPGIRDRGYVQIGDVSVGVLYREGKQTELKISLKDNASKDLFIIVENMGRLNFGDDYLDSKGILSNVTFDGKILTDWSSYLTNNWIPNFQMNNTRDLMRIVRESAAANQKKKSNSLMSKGTGLYFGTFTSKGPNYDTFLKMDKFTKGSALILTRQVTTNLGRYWPNMGPQVTLYTPGVFTEPGDNVIMLFEVEGTTCDSFQTCEVEFIDYPIIDSLNATTTTSKRLE